MSDQPIPSQQQLTGYAAIADDSENATAIIDPHAKPAPGSPAEELQRQLARKIKIEADNLEFDWFRLNASKDSARHYSFLGAVNLPTAQNCMDVLGQWTREDPSRDIRLVFTSPGGSVLDGLALYDYLAEIKNTLHENGGRLTTVALGQAASMAGILLQAGDHRVIGKNSYLLIHEITAGVIGNMSEINDSAAFTQRLQDRVLSILAERATITKDEIKTKWERRDWWLDSDEAKSLGFCDEVL